MTRYIIARANLIALAAWAVVLLLVGGMTWERFNAVQSGTAWIQHTHEVMASIQGLQLRLREAESGQRGYLLTGNDAYLAPYDAAIGNIGILEGELQRLTADNRDQQQRLRALAPLVQHKLGELAATVQLRRSAGFDEALRLVRTNIGRNDMVVIENVLKDMTHEEQVLLARRVAAVRQRGLWLSGLVLTGAFLAVLALAGAARMLNAAWAQSYRMENEERKLAARLRTSLDSLSQGVAVFDADRLLTNWNGCFQVLLQLPVEMIQPGTPYGDFVRHLNREQDLLESEAQISAGGAQAAGEAVTYERNRLDGHHLEIRRTSMPGGGFVLTISDMTKRIQAEGVLREVQKMQAIGQLTGGIAHDFNNLLTVILGNLEFAQKKLPEDHAVQSRIGRAVWAAQRGATLTAHLLAFARKQPLAPAPVDLSQTVPDLIPLLQRTLGAPIDVRYVGAAGLWPALADAVQLESALLNLALNARDAMPGGGRLTLELANKVLDETYARTHAEVTAGDYVMLAVSDTGHGMTPDVTARVFEPFFTTKPDGKGTGLGLAMVFGFVKQSKGHVTIYSEPGEGTSVRIYLPRAIGGLGAATTPVRTVAPAELARVGATVLVVEDEAAVREITVAILRDYGYRVLEAADGEEALRVFGAHASEISLLLSDVVLPGTLRGRDVAERITALCPETKVLFMSGYTENSIVHHGRLDEGVHLISKPFKREQLAAKVAEMFGWAPRQGVTVDEPANVVRMVRDRDV
jgi:signal transduction histidine kinase/FixJ family two-component response regulator